MFTDVRRAHFASWARGDIAVELPKQVQKEGEDLVGFLGKPMYGARDATAYWVGETVCVLVTILWVRTGCG